MVVSRRKKKQSVVVPRWMKKLASYVHGRGRPVALTVLLAAVFLGGWLLVWREVRRQVLSSDGYWITQSDVEITPPPTWVHTDIRAEVFRDASLDDPLSIMDEGLAERLANAFSLHAWISKVRRVSKHYPARVTVELAYRRPVCMVQVTGGLLPVDVEGVLLPSADFSPIEAGRYPRLVGVDTVPIGPAGTRWGDTRVVGGAEIATVLGEAWHRLELQQIVPLNISETGHDQRYTYELFTRKGTRIIWGRSPGNALPGDPPPEQKLARLINYAKKNGTLESPDGRQLLDVSRSQSMRVTRRPVRGR